MKRALGAQCFPVGGYAIQAYLPDEEVGISAFLCHGQEKSWFVRVNETLCKVGSEIIQVVTPSSVYRRYFQHAHFILIVGVGKRGAY